MVELAHTSGLWKEFDIAELFSAAMLAAETKGRTDMKKDVLSAVIGVGWRFPEDSRPITEVIRAIPDTPHKGDEPEILTKNQ